MQRHAALAGVVVQELHGGVAEPALGHVDDALEGEIVRGRMHHAQIGQRVADFLPLVKAWPADDAIGQAEGDEAVLELAHLERGAHQDGDLVERVRGRGARAGFVAVVAALKLLDLLADARALLPRSPSVEVTSTFSPGTSSVRSVLPSRPSLCAMRCEAAARMCAVLR